MNRAEFECIEGRWSGWAFSVAIMLGVLVSTGMPGASFATEDQLRFRSDGRLDRSLSIGALHEACPSQQVEVDDPYHEKRMRYAAWPLRCVLDAGFAERGGAEGLRGNGLLLRALDGYTRPVGGEDLLIPGGFVAYGEPERLADPASTSWFSPIDRRKTDPAPFYLVWTGVAQSDPHATAWPYQLAEIEVAPFEQAFPKTRPTDLVASDAGWGGYALFQKSCASCHAINGEGGKVGPDLNVPRSIVEYRPIPEIRAYIRNPEATRYTSMPAHPGLSEDDLDALIAYFSAMSQRKQDPRKQDEP